MCGEQGSGTATLSNVPNLLKETSKTYEMKTTAEKICKNCVCFKVRKGNPVSLPIKQKIPKNSQRTFICSIFRVRISTIRSLLMCIIGLLQTGHLKRSSNASAKGNHLQLGVWHV
jgi:hypothetical protein